MRMKISKHLLFALFIIFIGFEPHVLNAQHGFNTNKLEQLRSDPNLQYEIQPQAAEGSLQRLWQRFTAFIDSLLSSTASSIVFRLLLAVAVIYFLIKILGVEFTSVFSSSKTSKQAFISEENLDSVNLEAELEKARLAKNWRLVVRLVYLKALKLMWESEMVGLRKGKTNREYLYELEGKAVAAPFESLSFLFDYTWYGHFEATETISQKAENYFQEIFQKGTK